MTAPRILSLFAVLCFGLVVTGCGKSADTATQAACRELKVTIDNSNAIHDKLSRKESLTSGDVAELNQYGDRLRHVAQTARGGQMEGILADLVDTANLYDQGVKSSDVESLTAAFVSANVKMDQCRKAGAEV